MAEHRAAAPDLDQLHLPLVPRLKARRHAGWNVETHAVGLVAIELHGAVYLEKVIMTADLDGAIASVAHRQRHRAAARIEVDLFFCQKVFAWFHRLPRFFMSYCTGS